MEETIKTLEEIRTLILKEPYTPFREVAAGGVTHAIENLRTHAGVLKEALKASEKGQ